MLKSFADVRVPLGGCPTARDEVVVAVISITLGYAAIVVDRPVKIIGDWIVGVAKGAILNLDPEVFAQGFSAVEIVGNGREVILVSLRLK